jgi:hypothetical protein
MHAKPLFKSFLAKPPLGWELTKEPHTHLLGCAMLWELLQKD